jgi:hypothetical protein
VVYVSNDAIARAAREFGKLNVKTLHREAFVTVFTARCRGVTSIGLPIFTRDEKRYVYFRVRVLSALYVASGLT